MRRKPGLIVRVTLISLLLTQPQAFEIHLELKRKMDIFFISSNENKGLPSKCYMNGHITLFDKRFKHSLRGTEQSSPQYGTLTLSWPLALALSQLRVGLLFSLWHSPGFKPLPQLSTHWGRELDPEHSKEPPCDSSPRAYKGPRQDLLIMQNSWCGIILYHHGELQTFTSNPEQHNYGVLSHRGMAQSQAWPHSEFSEKVKRLI